MSGREYASVDRLWNTWKKGDGKEFDIVELSGLRVCRQKKKESFWAWSF
jgi:hypothetical protein